MVKSKKIITKAISLLLASFLLFTNCLFAHKPETSLWAERKKSLQATPPANQLALAPGNPLPVSTQFNLRQLSSTRFLPRSIDQAPHSARLSGLISSLCSSRGTIRKISLPPTKTNARTLLHIQDVHLNNDAQTNIGLTLQELITNKQIDLIALEGAFGAIDVSAFRRFSDHESVNETAASLLKDNKISGPILTALTSPADIPPIVGIDDPTHYAANVQAYRQSAPLIPSYKTQNQKHRSRLAKEKINNLNPALMDFDRQVEAYRNGTLPLSEYVKKLTTFAPPASQTKNITDFLQAVQLESSMDFKRVESERGALIERLAKKLTPVESQSLLSMSVGVRLGRVGQADFFRFVKNLCSKKKINLDQFTALNAYLRYVFMSDSLDTEALLKEIQQGEEIVYASLITSEYEKRLIDESKQLSLIGKLLDFSLTREEWKEYKSIGYRPWTIDYKLNLSSFERFYSEAEARDQAMTENLLKAMEKHNAKVAVLVTGGFHSDGIDRQARDSGLTTISFVPRISKIDTGNGATSLSVFTQEKTPLEKLAQGEKLFLSPPVWTKSTRILAGVMTASRSLWLRLGTVQPETVKNTLEQLTGIPARSFHIQIHGGDVHVTIDNQATVQSSFSRTTRSFESVSVSGARSMAGTLHRWRQLPTVIRELPSTLSIVFNSNRISSFVRQHANQNDLGLMAKRIIGARWIQQMSRIALGASALAILAGWGSKNWAPFIGLLLSGTVLVLLATHIITHEVQIFLFPEAPLSIGSEPEDQSEHFKKADIIGPDGPITVDYIASNSFDPFSEINLPLPNTPEQAADLINAAIEAVFYYDGPSDFLYPYLVRALVWEFENEHMMATLGWDDQVKMKIQMLQGFIACMAQMINDSDAENSSWWDDFTRRLTHLAVQQKPLGPIITPFIIDETTRKRLELMGEDVFIKLVNDQAKSVNMPDLKEETSRLRTLIRPSTPDQFQAWESPFNTVTVETQKKQDQSFNYVMQTSKIGLDDRLSESTLFFLSWMDAMTTMGHKSFYFENFDLFCLELLEERRQMGEPLSHVDLQNRLTSFLESDFPTNPNEDVRLNRLRQIMDMSGPTPLRVKENLRFWVKLQMIEQKARGKGMAPQIHLESGINFFSDAMLEYWWNHTPGSKIIISQHVVNLPTHFRILHSRNAPLLFKTKATYMTHALTAAGTRLAEEELGWGETNRTDNKIPPTIGIPITSNKALAAYLDSKDPQIDLSLATIVLITKERGDGGDGGDKQEDPTPAPAAFISPSSWSPNLVLSSLPYLLYLLLHPRAKPTKRTKFVFGLGGALLEGVTAIILSSTLKAWMGPIQASLILALVLIAYAVLHMVTESHITNIYFTRAPPLSLRQLFRFAVFSLYVLFPLIGLSALDALLIHIFYDDFVLFHPTPFIGVDSKSPLNAKLTSRGIPPSISPEDILGLLNDAGDETYANIRKAFHLFHTYINGTKAATQNALIGSDLNSPVSPSVRNVIMNLANRAEERDESRDDWKKFMMNVKPIALSIQRNPLPGIQHILVGNLTRNADELVSLIMGSQAPHHVFRKPHEDQQPQLTDTDMCFILKPPHGFNRKVILDAVRRLDYFGYDPIAVRVIDGDDFHEHPDILQNHYREHFAGFSEETPSPTLIQGIRNLFDSTDFEEKYGTAFNADMIVSGSQLMKRFGLSWDEVDALWQTGFPHGTKKIKTMGARYALPVQIKDPQTGHVKTLILVNGHFTSLVNLFAQSTNSSNEPVKTIVLYIRSRNHEGQSWQMMREEFLGGTNPHTAMMGSFRRDAVLGEVPVERGDQLSGAHNLAHLSAGPLEAMAELSNFFDISLDETSFGALLAHNGYSKPQLDTLAKNRVHNADGALINLFDLTEAKEQDEALAIIQQHLSPDRNKIRFPDSLKEMPAWEFLSVLGLEDAGLIQKIAAGTPTNMKGHLVQRINVASHWCPPETRRILRTELSNVDEFDLLFNAAGELLAIIPTEDTTRLPVAENQKYGDEKAVQYFDLTPYYFQIPSFDDPFFVKKWDAFHQKQKAEHQAIKQFLEDQRPGIALRSVEPSLMTPPFVYVEIHESDRIEVKSIDLSDFSKTIETIKSRLTSNPRIILPIFPTVYSPGEDIAIKSDHGYVKAVWHLDEDYQKQRGRPLPAIKDVLVMGGGSGFDTWLAHEMWKKWAQNHPGEKAQEPRFHVRDINPFAVANVRIMAKNAGFQVHADVGDNLPETGEYDLILWNMPCFNPQGTSKTENTRLENLHDGYFGPNDLAEFSYRLPYRLRNPHGVTLLWSAVVANVDPLLTMFMFNRYSPLREEMKVEIVSDTRGAIFGESRGGVRNRVYHVTHAQSAASISSLPYLMYLMLNPNVKPSWKAKAGFGFGGAIVEGIGILLLSLGLTALLGPALGISLVTASVAFYSERHTLVESRIQSPFFQRAPPIKSAAAHFVTFGLYLMTFIFYLQSPAAFPYWVFLLPFAVHLLKDLHGMTMKNEIAHQKIELPLGVGAPSTRLFQALSRLSPFRNIRRVQTVANFLGEREPFPQQIDVMVVFGNYLLRVVNQAADIWMGIKGPKPMLLIAGGVGSGTWTLNQIKKLKGLGDAQLEKKTFEEVDYLLDALASLKKRGDNAFWHEMETTFNLINGWDREKKRRGLKQGELLWEQFYKGVFSEEELEQKTIEELVMERLLDRKTRYDTKIPEGILFLALCLAKGIPINSIRVEIQSTTSIENVNYAAGVMKKNNLHPKTILAFQQPLLQKRMKAAFEKQVVPHWAEWNTSSPQFINYAGFQYSLWDLILMKFRGTLKQFTKDTLGELKKLEIYSKPPNESIAPTIIPDPIAEIVGELEKTIKKETPTPPSATGGAAPLALMAIPFIHFFKSRLGWFSESKEETLAKAIAQGNSAAVLEGMNPTLSLDRSIGAPLQSGHTSDDINAMQLEEALQRTNAVAKTQLETPAQPIIIIDDKTPWTENALSKLVEKSIDSCKGTGLKPVFLAATSRLQEQLSGRAGSRGVVLLDEGLFGTPSAGETVLLNMSAFSQRLARLNKGSAVHYQLVVSYRVVLDYDGVPADSPLRSAAIIFINQWLQAIPLLRFDENQFIKAARLLAQMA